MAASPETVQRIIATYRQAAALHTHAPARHGHADVPDAHNAAEALTSADLHGDRINFSKLVEIPDLANHPRRHLVMQEVCHGGPTYPGGGCMSHIMLEAIARLKTEFPEQFHFLLSNHELAELTDFPITKNRRVLNLAFRCGLQEMYGSA